MKPVTAFAGSPRKSGATYIVTRLGGGPNEQTEVDLELVSGSYA